MNSLWHIRVCWKNNRSDRLPAAFGLLGQESEKSVSEAFVAVSPDHPDQVAESTQQIH